MADPEGFVPDAPSSSSTPDGFVPDEPTPPSLISPAADAFAQQALNTATLGISNAASAGLTAALTPEGPQLTPEARARIEALNATRAPEQQIPSPGPAPSAYDAARQHQQALAEASPVASTAGTVVGAGLGALGGVAAALPAALAEQAGLSIAKQVGARFGEGAMSRIATMVAGTAATGGMAASVQAIADTLGELPSDPAELMAWGEHVAMQAGKGALFGAAVGGGLGVVREVASGALRLATSATQQAQALAAKYLPAMAEQRAVSAITRGGKASANKPPNVGRVLLDERIPLDAGSLPVLEERAAAASKTVLDLENQVIAGKARPDVLAAAAEKERALVWARDAAKEAAAKPAGELGSAAGDIAMGALVGAALGGGPGAVVGAAAKRAVRYAASQPGYQAVALDQLAQLAENRAAVVQVAAMGQEAIGRLAQGAASKTVIGTRFLDPRWGGPELDAEIEQAQRLTDESSPERADLALARDRLEMAAPGVGAAFEAGIMRRAQLMTEGVPPRSKAVYSGQAPIDPLTRSRLGERLRVLREPEQSLARVMAGEDTPELVRTFKSAYPRAWEQFTTELASAMVRGEAPTFQDQLAMGVRTGIATHDSLTPERLAYGYAATKFRDQQAAVEQPPPSEKKKFGWKSTERYGDKADRVGQRRDVRGSQ